MLTGHKFRLYPSVKEQSVLRLWIGHQRFIYNAKTQEQDYWFKFYKHSLSLTGLDYYPDQSYSQFRNNELTPWLNLVPPEILRNGSYKYITAYKRFTQGLGGTPNRKKAFGRQSVMITSELFSFDNNSLKLSKNHTINIGNKKFPLGKLQFKAHKEYNLPKSITVSVNPSGHWFISFNSEEIISKESNIDNNQIIRTQEELMYEFSLRTDLESIVVGLDRGVVLPVATSHNSNYSIDKKVLAKIAKKEFRAKRYQRKLSRQQLGSKNRNKTKNKIGKLKQYQTNVRQDFCHKTSHDLVSNPNNQVFVLENLKLKNMMAAPKPKQDTKGNYLPNGSAAKAGLNKALANSSLGLVKQFITYKAIRRNKLVLSINPAYSSQECSECHFIHKDNRITQDQFKCASCGHEDNADINAAKVIKYRGIEFLKSFDFDNYKPKSKKTVRIRKKVGKVLPEPISDKLESKPVENMLDIEGIKLLNVQRSMNQETPTISTSFSGGWFIYKQGISIGLEKFHDEVGKNIPYVELILSHQKENYDLSYIEYLVENHRSDVAIKFFESIKYIKDDSESHNCSRLLEIICENKDIELFKYVSTYPVAKLYKFDYQVKLFNIFFREGFKEALELVASKMPSPHLLLIDNILNKGCSLSREEFLAISVDYSFIPKQEFFQLSLLDYYESPEVSTHRNIIRSYEGIDKDQMIKCSPEEIMNRAVFSSIGTGKPSMDSNQLKAYMSKRKLQFNFKSDAVAKSIWSKYKLEYELKEKDTPFRRETKI